ncbi:GYF domain-containing protein [Solimonas sp. SE-A11]|uniref:GYF domain-containing protein n=1 Tax=Solimonas sp. SE-A11 TaxID=3054954 RepID=UPI00259C9A04|nr:GYF domain-containing protein [Solimonas sp. SE-A11]MDM4771242.1 GYF domain-containing protein [Solimonas sp. SE-A11]
MWFYAGPDGIRHGPVTRAALAELIASGQVSGNVLVWSAGMNGWQAWQTVFPAPTPAEAAPKPAWWPFILGQAMALAMLGGSWWVSNHLGDWTRPMLHFASTSVLAVAALLLAGLTSRRMLRGSQGAPARFAGAAGLIFLAFATLPTLAILRQVYILDASSSGFTYTVSSSGRQIRFTGMFGPGAADAMKQAYRPGVTQEIEFDSQGGLLDQSYNIADFIIEHGLETAAVNDCSSACLIPFLSGRSRRASLGTYFGFHSPGMPEGVAGALAQASDPMGEEYFDRLEKLGAPESLRERTRKTPNREMFFLGAETMRALGLVSGIHVRGQAEADVAAIQWHEVISITQAEQEASPSPLTAFSLALYQSLQNHESLQEQHAGPMYRSIVERDPSMDGAKVAAQLTRVTRSEAIGVAGAASIRRYVVATQRLVSNLAAEGHIDDCAAMGYSGEPRMTPQQLTKREDFRHSLDVLASLLAEASAMEWRARPPDPGSATRVTAMAQTARDRTASAGHDMTLLDSDHEAQCQFALHLLYALLAEPDELLVADYAYMHRQD